MILEKIRGLQKKGPIWGARVLLLLALTSCSTKKNYNDWVQIDRNNCSGYAQKGYGYTDAEISPLIKGRIRMCDNGEAVGFAKVFFLSSKNDTVGTTITDKKGDFSLALLP